MTGLLQTTGRRFLRPFKMMNIRWGRYIPSALRVITAACATGYAARCVKPAAFPRRCFITSRHLPSVFSISITGTFEAAYFLGHHPLMGVFFCCCCTWIVNSSYIHPSAHSVCIKLSCGIYRRLAGSATRTQKKTPVHRASLSYRGTGVWIVWRPPFVFHTNGRL